MIQRPVKRATDSTILGDDFRISQFGHTLEDPSAALLLPLQHSSAHTDNQTDWRTLDTTAMPIPLSLVATGSDILVESHDDDAERFLTAASTILTRIPPNSSRLSYAFEDWLFHYVSEDGFVYLCVADGQGGRRLPFAFLSEVQKQVSCKGMQRLCS